MLEQARAQSDVYFAEEDSDDKDFEPYTFQYEDMYKDRGAMEDGDAILPPVASTTLELGAQLPVAVPATVLFAFTTGDCPMRQESSVSSPCGDINMAMHQLQALTSSGSSAEIFVAGNACDAAAAEVTNCYATQQCWPS